VYIGSYPYMDFDGPSTSDLTTRYLTNPDGLNQFYGQVSVSGTTETTEWYLTDNLGSIRQVVSAAGTSLDAITYDPFGGIITQTNAADAPRFLYTGGGYDAITGTYQDGAREYDPFDGRWTSQDPLSFAAGDTNLYRYVFNDPLDAIDPTGDDIYYLLAMRGSPIAERYGHAAILVGPVVGIKGIPGIPDIPDGSYVFMSYSTGRNLLRRDDDIDRRIYPSLKAFNEEKNTNYNRYNNYLWFKTDQPITNKAFMYMQRVGTQTSYRLFRHNCGQIAIDSINASIRGINLEKNREPRNNFISSHNQSVATRVGNSGGLPDKIK
jgi:RHS repeat-associated protein